MLVHRWDAAVDDDEWRSFLVAQGFGHLVAAGSDREVPVVVPTQFVVDGPDVVLHLARPNPIWAAIDENPMVVLSVAGDWAYVPSAWKAIADEDPRIGIPTTYYGAVQLTARAEVIDQPTEVADVLRRQLQALQPELEVVDPIEHGAKLGQIRGLRLVTTEVKAKFKYGGNVDEAHQRAVAERLAARGGLGDKAARAHLLRRLGT
ncbi:MAG: FMN-binding negative transcriptional regulator [Acidimicrobiales bacterium]